MNLRSYLELEKITLAKKKHKLQSQLAKLPDGHIRFDKNGNSWKWRRIYDDNSSQKYTYLKKKETDLAQSLSLKSYIEDCISKIRMQETLIDRFLLKYPVLPQYPDQLSNRNPQYLQLLSPFFLKKSARVNDWLIGSYEKSAEHPERLIVPTKSGIMVRSKSEALIANELFDHHIPFRYEMAQIFGDIKIYPDFTIYHPDMPDTVILWEHFGLMDINSYAQNAKIKLGTYIDANYIPGKNLIVTYESKDMPLDINYISLLIAYHFM